MPPVTRGKFHIVAAKFPGRVLVIDDEALVCWSLATGLRQAGFVADTASTSTEALLLARVRPHPAVIVIDSRLHDCPAAVLLCQLRAVAPECRFVLMTTDRHEAPPAPYDALIVRKPFDLPDVVRQIGAEVARAQTG
ncbi:MAG TPA: response regulator [Vicinamibacterales bacterium]|nr:response regulator [Vicinamibacterales bacterium]